MAEEESYKLPSDKIMQHACRLALVDDKPILLIIGLLVAIKMH